jgi:hypothetical protein
LKVIGVVKDDKKDAYQDSVTMPLGCEHDNSGGGDANGLEEDVEAKAAPLGEVLTAIPNVSFLLSLELN